MDEIRVDAPAKINLALHVTGQRADGYHLLESLVTFTTAGDRLHIRRAAQDRFDVTGPFGGGIPAGGENLVIRALQLMRTRFKTARQPLAITLEKRLPVASGLGGGSSDAAALMKAVAALLRLPDDGELTSLALQLGADVPMCLSARPLVARGIGDDISPVTLPSLPLVLVNPGKPVATPLVFERLDHKHNQPLAALPAFKEPEQLADWLRTCRNDLQAPAVGVEPAIGEVLLMLEGEKPLLARMSGSGATCFALYKTESEALQAAAIIGGRRPGWFVQACTTIQGDSPND